MRWNFKLTQLQTMTRARVNHFKIRVVSPWFQDASYGAVDLSRSIPLDEADALLCYWAPSEELFQFSGPKAWYNCEPGPNFASIESGEWPRIKERLRDSEFLNHSGPTASRVPHITHWGATGVDMSTDRGGRAVAVVSNYGERDPSIRNQSNRMRNRIVTSQHVDLFGKEEAWSRYRSGRFSRPRPPRNYRGEIPGTWDTAEKRALMANYMVCVCMENTYEPHYFTEKFVEAVCAGCIPVYRAHPTVADSFLDGAAWIDPASHGMSPRRTLKAAAAAPLAEYQEKNAAWLRNNLHLARTKGERVFENIARLLSQRVGLKVAQ